MIAKLPEDILQGFFLKYREVEMRPMRGAYMGIEWKPLTLESKNGDGDEGQLNLPSRAERYPPTRQAGSPAIRYKVAGW